MNIKIFNQHVAFDREADFSQKHSSPGGSVFSVSTQAGVSRIKIKAESVREADAEHVLHVPLSQKQYKIRSISIPGPKPKKPKGNALLISIGGPKPKGPSPDPDAMHIELDSSAGSWQVEPDPAADALNIKFVPIKLDAP